MRKIGTIYKEKTKVGITIKTPRYKERWVAEITWKYKRYRFRSSSKTNAEKWLKETIVKLNRSVLSK